MGELEAAYGAQGPSSEVPRSQAGKVGPRGEAKAGWARHRRKGAIEGSRAEEGRYRWPVCRLALGGPGIPPQAKGRRVNTVPAAAF